MPQDKPIAITIASLNLFGCPYCGYRSGHHSVRSMGTVLWVCGDCGKSCCALEDGIAKSTIGVDGGIFPELQKHPRRGTPCHGKPDLRPDDGGEFFHSRGIGLERCTCFICGTQDRDGTGRSVLNNISAFVQCKNAGERVVAMFPQGARLDYRKFEPDRVQVKIGACDKHLSNLGMLDVLTRNGIITEAHIAKARE